MKANKTKTIKLDFTLEELKLLHSVLDAVITKLTVEILSKGPSGNKSEDLKLARRVTLLGIKVVQEVNKYGKTKKK